MRMNDSTVNKPVATTRPPTPSAMQLRDYQSECIEACKQKWQTKDRLLVVLPTGAGKTIIFAHIIKDYIESSGQKVLVVAHRDELLSQSADKIRTVEPSLKISVEAADKKADPDSDVIIASVQTIGKKNCKRLEWLSPGLVIIDECHHAAATTYQNMMNRFGCYDETGILTLGVTATPHRLDNKALHGNSSTAIFQEVAFTYSIKDAITSDYLVPPVAYQIATASDLSSVKVTAGQFNQSALAEVVNTGHRNKLAIDAWKSKAQGRQTIAFCVDVNHAFRFAAQCETEGIDAKVITGETPMNDRRELMQGFRRAEFPILANVEIATEGFDIPDVACILLLRPTMSWSLYTQMIGRGLRLAKDKEDCIIIDLVDNAGKHQLASIPDVLGVPTKSKFDGVSAIDIYKTFDGLTSVQRAAAEIGGIDFTNVQSSLKQIDLLYAAKTPPIVTQNSDLTWLLAGLNSYQLSTPSRQATLAMNALGEYELTIVKTRTKAGLVINPPEVLDRTTLGDDVDIAIREASNIALQHMPDERNLIDATLHWRKDAITDKQLATLSTFGLTKDMVSTLNKGEASLLITTLINQKKNN